MKPIITTLRYLWPSPYTLWGLFIGSIGLLTGGRMQLRDGIFECWGGFTAFFVRCLPPGYDRILAVTIGHVVLGQTESGINLSREHERVHVHQYERWGVFFMPAYLTASLIAWLQGKRAYRDNAFEVEAYDIEDQIRQSHST